LEADGIIKNKLNLKPKAGTGNWAFEICCIYLNPSQIKKISGTHWTTAAQASPKHNKKKDDFFFVYFGPHNNKSIQFINKPVFLFHFFHVDFLLLLANSNNNKNRHFIYVLSMLCLGLDGM
jgi:hypothetical protein